MSPEDEEPTYQGIWPPAIDLDEIYGEDMSLMTNPEAINRVISAWTHPNRRGSDIVEVILETTTPNHDTDKPHDTEVKDRFFAITQQLDPVGETDLFAHDLMALIEQTGPQTPEREAVETVLKAHLFEAQNSGQSVSQKLLSIYDRLCTQIIRD